MKTQQALKAMLPDIMNYILNNVGYLEYNNRLMLVFEGQLRKEIEDSLRKELSDPAYGKAIQRVPSINLLRRIVDKLSRVYTEAAVRTATVEADAKLIQEYEEVLGLLAKMPSANRMLNLHQCCALEPYLEEGWPKLRVLPANQFLVYSDSPTSPTTPTVFIKLMGRELKTPFTDIDGRKTKVEGPRYVEVYVLYSDTEILVVDSDGAIRTDKMEVWGVDGTNPVGCIPFVYINRSEFRLMPLPDTDTLENTILIPKLLADLNYAVQYQSHAIVVTTDLTVPPNVPWNPDVILNLKTDEDSKNAGSIETIKPEVDIEQVLMLIESTLSLWLESRNIKSTGSGKMTAEAAASGVAKIMDQSDATQDRAGQIAVFERAEADLWYLLSELHDYWVSNGLLEYSTTQFSKDFEPSFRFPDLAPAISDKERVESVRAKLEAGLIDKRGALKEINPYMKDDELDALVEATGASKVSLNGAQLAELTAVLIAAAAEQLPRSTTVEYLIQAFSMPADIAEKMVGEIGRGYVVPQQSTVPNGQAPRADQESKEPGDPGTGDSRNDSGANAK